MSMDIYLNVKKCQWIYILTDARLNPDLI